MADELDLQALRNGERDLVQADFRGADLSQLDLSNRDFSGAKFDQANLAKSDLRKSLFSKASLTQANLSEANMEGCSASSGFVMVNFTGSNLRSVNFQRSNFHTCNFSRADLRGADFSNANLINDNIFDDVLTDSDTKFDGAKILRPYIRNEAFRHYRLERGTLIRKTESNENESPEFARKSTVRDIHNQIELVRASVLPLVSEGSGSIDPHSNIGHNNPPEEFVLKPDEYANLEAALDDIKEYTVREERDYNRLHRAKTVIAQTFQKIIGWVSRKTDVLTDSFAEELGKTLASKETLITLSLIATGNMSKLLEMIDNLLK